LSRQTSANCELWHNWPRLSKRQSQSGNVKRGPKGKQPPHRAQAKGSGNGGRNKSGGVPHDSTNALLQAQLQALQAMLQAKDLEQKLHKQNRTSSGTFAEAAATKLVAASSMRPPQPQHQHQPQPPSGPLATADPIAALMQQMADQHLQLLQQLVQLLKA
jgi:hypothetical protein